MFLTVANPEFDFGGGVITYTFNPNGGVFIPYIPRGSAHNS